MPRKDVPISMAPGHGLTSRRVEALLLLVVWLLFLIVALRTFGSDSIYTNFHSDAAIPILMANDERPITIFDTYYYSADRWGGWPMLVGKELHLITGLRWNDQRLHYFRTTWLFLGLLVLAALNARAAPAVIVSALVVLCLEPTSRRLIFDLSQLYAWQVPALFLAWFCMRHLLAQRFRSEDAAPVRVRAVLWSAAFYSCAFLAIWSSVASGPLLAVLLTLEALRLHLSLKNTGGKRKIGLVVLLLFAAIASELLIKKNYHRHSFKHFGNANITPMWFDYGYLYKNLITNWHNVVQYTFFPLIAVALFFVLGIGGLLLYALVARNRPLMTRVVSFFEDETFTMIIALTAMAAMNFAIMISVSHVRADFYDVRFHSLTYLFGAISGLLTIYLTIRVVANRFAVARYVLPLVVVVAFIFLGVKFPPRVQNGAYTLYRQTALDLSQKAPGAILMGGYWETYIFAGLQPTNTMTPLPVEGVLNRIPWTPAMLHDSEQVVVEYRSSGIVGKESLPPHELRQYGNLLKLQDPRFYENGPYAFALYFNERSKP